MFNSLAYIPNILAYMFVVLLLVILGFIVIYIAHKIYTTLYDNLPVAQLASKHSLGRHFESVTSRNEIMTLANVSEGQLDSKSKTALRIILTLEPCYLACIKFQRKLLDRPATLSKLYKISGSSAGNRTLTFLQRDSQVTDDNCLIKYFDSLASIPRSQDLQNCDDFKFKNSRSARKRTY